MSLDFGNKIENGGATPRGRVSANEFNMVVEEVNKHGEQISTIQEKTIPDMMKELDGKAGVFYYDSANNRTIVFANNDTKEAYLSDPTQTHLMLGSFDAPFNYSASINLLSPTFVSFLDGTKNVYVDFTFDTANKSGASIGEPVVATYTFVKNGTKRVVNEVYQPGTQVHFKVDDYISVGTNYLQIGISGQNTLAATTVGVTFLVVDLELSDTFDISKCYTPSKGMMVEFPYSVGGYGTKTMEWYLDGELLEYNKTEDEVFDISTTRTKYIDLSLCGHGKHSIQARAYVTLDGERFYSDTLYRDVIVDRGESEAPIIAISTVIPSGQPIVTGFTKLYGMTQYIPYNLQFSVYNPTNAAFTNTSIVLGDKEVATVAAANEYVYNIGLRAPESGTHMLTIVAGDTTYSFVVEVEPSSLSIEEIAAGLQLNLQAIGRTNSDVNVDSWEFNDYETEFSGFNWNNQSGWVNNRLIVNKGASIAINIAPLSADVTKTGATYEFEFETRNVVDDDAVICDLRGDSGAGIVITASEAKMLSSTGNEVYTRFKSGESIRVSFVVNRRTGTTNKGLVMIYVNGKISGTANYIAVDNFLSTKGLVIGNTELAEIAIKDIRFYENALNSEQILNNYTLYRDNMDDMFSVYDNNNIYIPGTQTISVDAIAAKVPVMIFTGNIPELENTTDKNKTIYVDIEYINMQDPTRSFTTKNSRMRPQGTSSMGYPKKNFRTYTNYGTMWDYLGNIVPGGLYSFKTKSQPVACYCYKADYAESSGTHNTGIARLMNDVMRDMQIDGEYLGRTEAQQAAVDNNYDYDVRTTVDGMPVVLLYRLTADSDLVFIGKYNFNNDKSTESVFGFKDIPGYDNSKTQCWEVLNNGNHIALFEDTDNFDNEWDEAFEARYPDGSDDVSDLKVLCEWLVSTRTNPKTFGENLTINAEIKGDDALMYQSQETYAKNGTYADNAENRLKKFAKEKWDHLDVWKMAATYIYKIRFGAVDQMVKNMMWTTEGTKGVGTFCKWFDILYDNDTINGTRNDGFLKFLWNIMRDTLDESFASEVHCFAGFSSTLYNNLEADEEFMRICSVVDNAMYMAGLSYNNVMDMFNNKQAGSWCERIYNQDAQYKYISPFVNSGVNNLFMLQGDKSLHRKWWLSKRFELMDSFFVSGEFKSKSIEFKVAAAPKGIKFSVTAGEKLYYGYGVNNVVVESGHRLDIDEKHEYETKQVLNIGDPIRIYGARSTKELDISNFAPYLSVLNIKETYSDVVGTCLERLIVGNAGLVNTSLENISGLTQAAKLKYLDIQNMKAMLSIDLTPQVELEELHAFGSGLVGVVLPNGGVLRTLQLPGSMVTLQLLNQPSLNSLEIDSHAVKLRSIDIRNCDGIDTLPLLIDWLENKETADMYCTVRLEGVRWAVDVDTMNHLVRMSDSEIEMSISGDIHVDADVYDMVVEQWQRLFPRISFTCNNVLRTPYRTIQVVDAKTEQPVSGVLVTHSGENMETDSEGKVVIRTGMGDTYELSKEGYIVEQATYPSSDIDTIETVVFYIFPTRRIVVTSSTSGDAIAGADVVIDGGVSSYKTNADGVVEFITEQAFSAEVSFENCQSFSITEPYSKTNTQTTVVLVSIPVRTIYIQNSSNAALTGVTVTNTQDNTSFVCDSGTVTITDASADNSVILSFSKSGYGDVTQEFPHTDVDVSHTVKLYAPVKCTITCKRIENNRAFAEGVKLYKGDTYYGASDLLGLIVAYLPPGANTLTLIDRLGTTKTLNVHMSTTGGTTTSVDGFSEPLVIPEPNGNIQLSLAGRYTGVYSLYITCTSACVVTYGDSSFTVSKTGSYNIAANSSGEQYVEISQCGGVTGVYSGSSTALSTSRYYLRAIYSIGNSKISNFSAWSGNPYNDYYAYTGLRYVGADLFKNDTTRTDFSSCLYGCYSLSHIPAGLFDNCTAATKFYRSFGKNYLVSEIPTGLFDNCPNATDFNECFAYCYSIDTVPKGLIDACLSTNNMESMFYYCTKLPFGEIPNTATSPNVQHTYNYCNQLRYLLCKQTTPPTFNATLSSAYKSKIYVPNASVQEYKETSGWSGYADNIFPTSEYFIDENIVLSFDAELVINYINQDGEVVSSQTINRSVGDSMAVDVDLVAPIGWVLKSTSASVVLEERESVLEVLCYTKKDINLIISPKNYDGEPIGDDVVMPITVGADVDWEVDIAPITVDGTVWKPVNNKPTINVPFSNDGSVCIDVTFVSPTITWTGAWGLSNVATFGEHSYKSNVISHNQSTVQRVTVLGIREITFCGRNYAEAGYDFLTIGHIDTPCTRTSYSSKLSTSSTTEWSTYKYILPDAGEHYIEFCFSKDSSASAGDDACYVYINSFT